MSTVNKNNITIISISGGSGSGKTTIANMLKEHYSNNVTLLSLDSYYKDLSNLSKIERENTNFDHPDSIDFELFKKHVKALKNNNSINEPIYSFEFHNRLEETNEISPKSIILLEGLYAFYDSEICKLSDYKIYIDAPSDLRLIRRIRRDALERGRDVESVLTQYEKTVRIMHNEYIKTQKQSSDIVINNDGVVNLEQILNSLTNKIKNSNC